MKICKWQVHIQPLTSSIITSTFPAIISWWDTISFIILRHLIINTPLFAERAKVMRMMGILYLRYEFPPRNLFDVLKSKNKAIAQPCWIYPKPLPFPFIFLYYPRAFSFCVNSNLEIKSFTSFPIKRKLLTRSEMFVDSYAIPIKQPSSSPRKGHFASDPRIIML